MITVTPVENGLLLQCAEQDIVGSGIVRLTVNMLHIPYTDVGMRDLIVHIAEDDPRFIELLRRLPEE